MLLVLLLLLYLVIGLVLFGIGLVSNNGRFPPRPILTLLAFLLLWPGILILGDSEG